MKLADVVAVLQQIAPLAWAEEWDNVGLLIEPPGRATVRTVLLCIDLDSAVLDEAQRTRCDLVIAYHPPLFTPLRRLTLAEPAARLALRCIAARIAVYSPHTALDAAPAGVNDWLADGLGDGARAGILARGEPGCGAAQGRLVTLARPVRLTTLVQRLKAHLQVATLRVAVATPHRAGAAVRDVAVCAGAGGSVLASTRVDVWLTGELRHHDMLAAVERGTSVILGEHTTTERGYLTRLVERLRGGLPGVKVAIARADRELLTLV